MPNRLKKHRWPIPKGSKVHAATLPHRIKRKLYRTRAWRETREAVFLRSPLCADPFKIHAPHGSVVAATECDHIVPSRLRKVGDFFDMDNLQGLCKACHDRKSRDEGSFKGLGVKQEIRQGVG